MNTIKTYYALALADIRSQMQHKASFIMASISNFAATIIDFLGIWALFSSFGALDGWTIAQIAVLYGIINISFTTEDTTLNKVAKVQIKDAKLADQFEIFDYGNGQYAIGFKDGNVDKSLIGKTVTVTLNVFIEGNPSAKANAAVSIKLTVVK